MARKSKRARCSDVEDRLSSLPDDILIHNVFPLLPMRETVRTSILNRRWRTLWRCVPRMDFHPPSAKAVRIPTKQIRTFFSQEGGVVSKFVERGDRVMGAYEGASATLHQFSVVFPLDKSLSSKIQSWLEFALAKKVEVLELDLCRDFGRYNGPEFPLIPPRLLPNLRALRSLTLGGVSITNTSLDHLLRGCESLERLKLHRFSSLTEVNITSPVSKLKSIEILGQCCISIKILAPTPDLVSLTLPAWTARTSHIEHAPRLVALTLSPRAEESGFNPVLHPLLCYLSQLETLDLRIMFNFGNQDVFQWLHHLRGLNRLKHLKLALSFRRWERFSGAVLRGLASVIKAASSVRHLTLDVYHVREKLEIPEEFHKLRPQNLRVIEIVGFRGRKDVCELALRLIKCAVSLEKLIIDHRDTSQCKLRNEYGRSKGTIQRWKGVAKALIEPELPSTVDLLVV